MPLPGRPIREGTAPVLVLSRKVGEKIFIGEKISVTVVRVAPGIVRLGIEAPDDLAIVREEIMDRAAANAQPAADEIKLA